MKFRDTRTTVMRHFHGVSQRKRATVYQLTTMLSTSKNVLFPDHNHLLTTGADYPTLKSLPEHQRFRSSALVISRWLWPANRTFLEVNSMVDSGFFSYFFLFWGFFLPSTCFLLVENFRTQALKCSVMWATHRSRVQVDLRLETMESSRLVTNSREVPHSCLMTD